jgi:hypothetical protein
VASSTVAHGWSHYLVSFLGIFHRDAAYLDQQPVHFEPALGEWVTGAVMNLPARWSCWPW